MVRIVGAIVAGIIVFAAVLMALEFLAHQIFQSSPAGAIPDPMHAFVAAAYFLASLAGGAVAGRISGQHWVAWLIAILVAAGAAYTLTTFIHPLWMQVASIVAPLAGGFLASRMTRPRQVSAAG